MNIKFRGQQQYFFIEVSLCGNSIATANAPESDLSMNVIIMYNKMRYQSINR